MFFTARVCIGKSEFNVPLCFAWPSSITINVTSLRGSSLTAKITLGDCFNNLILWCLSVHMCACVLSSTTQAFVSMVGIKVCLIRKSMSSTSHWCVSSEWCCSRPQCYLNLMNREKMCKSYTLMLSAVSEWNVNVHHIQAMDSHTQHFSSNCSTGHSSTLLGIPEPHLIYWHKGLVEYTRKRNTESIVHVTIDPAWKVYQCTSQSRWVFESCFIRFALPLFLFERLKLHGMFDKTSAWIIPLYCSR